MTTELYNPAAVSTKDCAGATLSIPAGMASVPVACYGYDTANRPTSVKDPRTGLSTAYGYGTANQLTSITPAGQASAPITLVYSTLEGRLKLSAVTRPQPAPLSGTADLTRIVYSAPLSGTGLPDPTGAAVGSWGQAKARRVFEIHSHRIGRWPVTLHYHRRPGIGWHRPWQRGI